MQAPKWLCVTVLSVFITIGLSAQQLRLGDNPFMAEKSAVLELASTNQGLLMPRISDTALINALNPPDGMLIYYTPISNLMIRREGVWEKLMAMGSVDEHWSVNGNANGGTKKIGNTDNFNLSIITNNLERIRVDNTGKVGIGNSLPTEMLDVAGNLKFSGALMPNNNAGTAGYVLRSNGTNTAPSWERFRMTDLEDADVSSAQTGQVLQYNGSLWVNITPSYLTSVDTGNIANFHTKVRSLFGAGTGIGYHAGTGAITNTGVTSLNGSTGAITMDTTFIASFSQKVRSLFSGVAPLSVDAAGQVSMTQASSLTNGYLSYNDWNTFNNKQSSGNYMTALTGDVTAAGPGSSAATIANGVVTYNKMQNTLATNVVLGRVSAGAGVIEEIATSGTGSVLRSVSPTITTPIGIVKGDVGLGNVDNTSDLNKPISNATQTALNAKINLSEKAANNGVATLDAVGKIPSSQLPVGPQVYRGTWNPATNSPTLSDATGVRGDTYRVVADGTVNLGSGNITFISGDDIIHNGTIWQRNPATSDVKSVNGLTGVVTLNSNDIIEGTVNKYYTDARADLKINVSEKAANNGVATLDGGGKVPVSQLPFSAMVYKGTWDANANNPTLSDATGSAGFTYRVSVAGTTNLGSGPISFNVGDEVIHNGSIWQRTPSSASVTSVNGQSGAVILNTDHISEGATNKYYTDARVKAAITVSAPLTFNTTTGNISLPQATSAVDGYLSAADWTTFNQKQAAGNYVTALTGDVEATGPGSAVATIAPNAVTFGKMQNISANKLLGSGSSGNTIGEITLGSGLTFTGNTLSASGSSGSVTSFSAGNLSPLFTTTVTNPTTTPNLSFSLSSQASNLVFMSPAATSGVPTFRSLVKADLPSTVVYNNQSNTYTSGSKQIFTASSLTADIQLTGSTTDPTTLSNGDVWYNSGTSELKYRANGVTRTVVNANEAQTLTNKTISGANNTITNIPNSALTNSTIALALGTTGTDANVSGSPASLGGTLTLNIPSASATNRGLLTATNWSTFNAKENALTFSTGLTRTTNTITSNLSTGVAGGQSVVGGTAASNNLTLSSTTNATKGKIVMGTSAYDEANNRLGVGTNAPTNAIHVNATNPLRLEGLQTASGNAFLVVDNNGVVTKSNTVGITALIKATYNIDLPNIGNNGDAVINVSVAGCRVGDNVIVTPGGPLTNTNGTGFLFLAYSYVSVDGQVTMRFGNGTSTSVNVPPIDFYITVIR